MSALRVTTQLEFALELESTPPLSACTSSYSAPIWLSTRFFDAARPPPHRLTWSVTIRLCLFGNAHRTFSKYSADAPDPESLDDQLEVPQQPRTRESGGLDGVETVLNLIVSSCVAHDHHRALAHSFITGNPYLLADAALSRYYHVLPS